MAMSDGSPVDILESVTLELWIIAIIFFGIGDMLTTNVGLMTGWAAEVSPIGGILIEEFGLSALFPLKLAVFVICFVLWRLTPRPQAVGVPLGLATLGVLVTTWNTFVLVAANL